MSVISVTIIGDKTAKHFNTKTIYEIESMNYKGYDVKVEQAKTKIVPKPGTRCGAVILPNGKIHLI